MKRNSPADNIAESNLIGVELLTTDAKTALTLLDLAETTSSDERRSRNLSEAYRAYQTIQRFIPRLKFTAEQREILEMELNALSSRLRAAGVLVDEPART